MEICGLNLVTIFFLARTSALLAPSTLKTANKQSLALAGDVIMEAWVHNQKDDDGSGG